VAVTETARPDDAAAHALWAQFVVSRADSLREELISHYLPLARMVAAKLYRLRPDNSVSFDDYLQYARVGLLEAIDRYDPEREASFETFSSYRIRGAVLNGLGRESEIAAQRAYWSARTQERVDSLQPAQTHGTADLDDFVQLTVGLALGFLLDRQSELVDASAASNPYSATELAELRSVVRGLVEQLPAREREIVRQHYFHEREFQLIASDLGLTKGRVSQLHSQALRRVAELLNKASFLDKHV
jgi:RNA polymerase sigma factor for flagellar operon FliA